MASASINVRISGSGGSSDGISGSIAIQPQGTAKEIKKLNQHNKNTNSKNTQKSNTTEKYKTSQKVEINMDNVKSPPASNTEVLNHVENVLKATAGVAKSVGADDAADILDKSAKVAETIPVAVQGIKREIEPVTKAGKGLWNALESRGIVGRKERSPNLKDMHKKK